MGKQLGIGQGGLLHAGELPEAADGLRRAVFGQGEIGAGQPVNRIALVIRCGHIDQRLA